MKSMPETMPCPSCLTPVEIPDGAAAIRCPKCGMSIEMLLTDKAPELPVRGAFGDFMSFSPPPPQPSPETEKPPELPVAKALPPKGIPVAKALPPKGPVAAIPLPFDRPTAPPPPLLPTAKPLPIDKPVVRGRVITEDDEARAELRRQEQLNRDIEEEEKAELYEETEKLYAIARTAIAFLAYGCLLGVIMTLSFSAYLVTFITASSIVDALFYVVIGLIVLQSILFMCGFGYAAAGPTEMRAIAALGLIITIMQIGLGIAVSLFGLKLAEELGNEDGVRELSLTVCLFYMAAGPSMLCGFTDIPWMLFAGELARPWYVVMIVVGGVLEFWRASILGTIVQYYAAEAKSTELGYQALRFVYRIIWVIIAAAGAKLLFYLGFKFLVGDFFAAAFTRIPQGLFSIAFFLWWLYTWLSQFHTLRDITEIATADRVLDERRTLDAY
jgi:LSD1 subclass zinc finger protein